MIGFFPELYPDELLYSWFARFYVYSGYTSAASLYSALYDNKSVRPSIELVNNLSYDAVRIVKKYSSIQELAIEHTLFPEYGRFIAPDLREKLLTECDFMKGNWSNAVKLPLIEHKRCIRYCPLCAVEDREKYGEAYWHRIHQITKIKICTKHSVFLKDSCIVIDKNLTRLKAAEVVVPEDTDYEQCDSKRIIELADYLEAVFHNEKYSHKQIGKYLSSRLDGYNLRGNGDRSMSALYEDYKSFYDELDEGDLMKLEYLPRLLQGKRSQYYYVCQMGLFEGITPKDLLVAGDEFRDDFMFFRISKQLDEPIELVEKIGNAILTELKTNTKSSTRITRYNQFLEEEDKRLLPRVKLKVKEMYGYGDMPPRKISGAGVSKSLGIDYHKFKRLKKCMAEVDKYRDTKGEYWSRKLVWAIRQLEKNNEKLTQKQIRKYTSVKRSNVIDCLDELKSKDYHVYKVICELYKRMPEG